MDMLLIVAALVALAVGLLVGWLFAGRASAGLRAERDVQAERARAASADVAEADSTLKRAFVDLAAEVGRREAAELELAALNSQSEERARAFEAQIAQLKDAQATLSAQFSEVGAKMLDAAQKQFLERADARFRESEATSGQHLKAMLQPVQDRLEKYEAAVTKVEAERQEAYGNLTGLIGSMRDGQERVQKEAANLVNSLRNAPKARGRWGEQQLRNVLESCGLSEHVDFITEVSVDSADGRLRPDAIIRVPGGSQLIVDAKVSLNSYQDAYGAADEGERARHMLAHAAAIKNHVTTLGAKAYQSQFEAAPDYVIMFIPGEHFLSAALEQDHDLWNYAFARNILLATPTNLVAIARTVAGVWRQEAMAAEATEIARLGKELYARMMTMGDHVARLGKNLGTAMGAYNSFVGSFESQVLSQAKRFEDLKIETGGKRLDALPLVEQSVRPLAKLTVSAVDADAAQPDAAN